MTLLTDEEETSWLDQISNSHTLERRPYPFCHAKRQSDFLGGWVVKNIFIMMFCVTKWFQRRSDFKRKNIMIKYKKLKRTYVCFPLHQGSYLGGTCTRQVFKFYFCNQSIEIGS